MASSDIRSRETGRDGFNILCLSGGGFMGLYTAHVLAYLERLQGRPLRESFDLIAGTSIGGILGLAITLGIPMAPLVKHFEQVGPQIFSRRGQGSRIKSAASLWNNINRAKYDQDALRNALRRICPEDLRLQDIDHRLMMPAVNMTDGQPYLFRSGYTSNMSVMTSSGQARDAGLTALEFDAQIEHVSTSAIDAALATAAAPTFFPPVTIGGRRYVDGGIFANSPDLLALHDAEIHLGIARSDISMLSIGTTKEDRGFDMTAHAAPGIRSWMEDRKIIRMMMSANQQSTLQAVKLALGNRFVRLDVSQGAHRDVLGFDKADRASREALSQLAQATIRDLAEHKHLRSMLFER